MTDSSPKMTNAFASLSKFRPKEQPAEGPPAEDVRRVADLHGFVQQNMGGAQAKKINKHEANATKEPMTAGTVRVRLADWNRFQAYCLANRYPAWVAFEQLVKHLPDE